MWLVFCCQITVTEDIRVWRHLVADFIDRRHLRKGCTATLHWPSVASTISSIITSIRACLIWWQQAIRVSHWQPVTHRAITCRSFRMWPLNDSQIAPGRSLLHRPRRRLIIIIYRRHPSVPEGRPCPSPSSSSSSAVSEYYFIWVKSSPLYLCKLYTNQCQWLIILLIVFITNQTIINSFFSFFYYYLKNVNSFFYFVLLFL